MTRERMLLTCVKCGVRCDLTVPEDATQWECISCEAIQDVPRYTLQQARRILARKRCDLEGHSLEAVIIHNDGRTLVSHMIRCERCEATFTEDTK